jgi:CRP-like cAMP-binding protein
MAPFDQTKIQNRLLGALPSQTFELLRPYMEAVDLPLRHVLVQPDEPTSHVCFLESGLGSIVASSTDNETVEVGHVGREGMTGSHILLKTNITPNKTFMQVAGSGIQVPVQQLDHALDQHPPGRDLLLRYVHACELQLAHSALANARYNVHERLARWLLMCHDRLEGDELPVTHEFLALMLGVRRSGVTNEIHIIEGLHAIKATRGTVRVIDRAKLEDIAGGCYGIPEREYERLVGVSIKADGR